MSGELTEALARVLGETLEREGGGPGSSIHSWRCEQPDRYGPCDCVMQVAREQAADLAPVVAEHVAGERERLVAALRYISSPTMGLPAGVDAYEFAMDGATDRNARYALQICIRTARAALATDREASGGEHG